MEATKKSNIKASFPVTLHRMLCDAESDKGMKDIVCWTPNGKAFIIKDKKAFEKQVMPVWFYRLKFSSFQRQLCLYGFKKARKETDIYGAMYHEEFLRDEPGLACHVVPKGKQKKNVCQELSQAPSTPTKAAVGGAQQQLHGGQEYDASLISLMLSADASLRSHLPESSIEQLRTMLRPLISESAHVDIRKSINDFKMSSITDTSTNLHQFNSDLNSCSDQKPLFEERRQSLGCYPSHGNCNDDLVLREVYQPTPPMRTVQGDAVTTFHSTTTAAAFSSSGMEPFMGGLESLMHLPIGDVAPSDLEPRSF